MVAQSGGRIPNLLCCILHPQSFVCLVDDPPAHVATQAGTFASNKQSSQYWFKLWSHPVWVHFSATSTTMAEPVIAPVEQAFCALPFGNTPIGRVVLAGGAGAAVAYFVRPSVSFDANGDPRPWILLDSKNPQACLFPAWAWIVVPGVTFGLFL